MRRGALLLCKRNTSFSTDSENTLRIKCKDFEELWFCGLWLFKVTLMCVLVCLMMSKILLTKAIMRLKKRQS